MHNARWWYLPFSYGKPLIARNAQSKNPPKPPNGLKIHVMKLSVGLGAGAEVGAFSLPFLSWRCRGWEPTIDGNAALVGISACASTEDAEDPFNLASTRDVVPINRITNNNTKLHNEKDLRLPQRILVFFF
jgi:hypothetical protein